MKHSAALKVNVKDVLALNLSKDGVLWEVISIHFPAFTIQELGTNHRPRNMDYCYFSKPIKAQWNAHKKRKEKCNECGN